MLAYRYEVRCGAEVVATGRLSHERPPQAGQLVAQFGRDSN